MNRKINIPVIWFNVLKLLFRVHESSIIKVNIKLTKNPVNVKSSKGQILSKR